MAQSLSLLVAYPKPVIRAGLLRMLEGSGIKVIGEANHARDAVSMARKLSPTVILIDAILPGVDSFDVVRKLRSTVPDAKLLVLSAVDNPTYMARAHAAGATDYLLESLSADELVTTIKNAAAGKPPGKGSRYAAFLAQLDARESTGPASGRLTPREQQVLRHISLGLPNKEIASSLAISVETVKEHVQNILRKMGLKDRTQAAVWAAQHEPA
ncbi:MAG: response regulator transcription factor [Planctomycetes bacterium]|nr:response regulator transcription factor [Planctomycetota bacterium]MBM4058132.1 response regulator transcription factor [Planctomycetota bacterium]